ncbi:MAG: NUDIX domain-containing protein, partial [Clostridia bacterium]|nr:NUDIX domain-containing protein [Clostridia bacterium]
MIFTTDNKIVVPKRSGNRRVFQNYYDCSVEGHVLAGENYEDAAYRELEEELGITNVKLEEIGYFKPYDINTSAFSKMYKLVYDGELNYDKDGIQEIFYMDKEEI